MAAQQPERGSIKDTIVSVVIAFVLAFVFRSFVIEAFVIPTGSMAPTLNGAHVRFRSPQSGFDWAVNPRYYLPGMAPKARQGLSPDPEVVVTDPMTGWPVRGRDMSLSAGDRILVLKYLRRLYEPARWDVVVFKAPHQPQENFIKRLVGLPGEELAFIDGDLFVRSPDAADPPLASRWGLPGWSIARKPERAQRALWMPVFGSEFSPADPINRGREWAPWMASRREGEPWFAGPWQGQGWDIDPRGSYRYAGTGPAVLDWDAERWPISDRYPYNETSDRQDPVRLAVFPVGEQIRPVPVSDLRLRCGVQPDGPGASVTAVVRAREHEFAATISGGRAALSMRPEPTAAVPDPAWSTLAEAAAIDLPPGRVTNVEFWHADQALQLWAGGRLVVSATYDWSPEERLRRATGLSLEDVTHAFDQAEPSPLSDPTRYSPARPRWEFSGGPVTLHRVGLDRDLHYVAVDFGGTPGRGTHPHRPVILGPDQFFCCGDNSPSSSDSRAWPTVSPWVEHAIGPPPGIVPRELLQGRAFFVYFPALSRRVGVPIPDIGRVRWIW